MFTFFITLEHMMELFSILFYPCLFSAKQACAKSICIFYAAVYMIKDIYIFHDIIAMYLIVNTSYVVFDN